MKIKAQKLTVIIIFSILIFIVLTNSSSINHNIITAFDLWLTKVFPSLFPMFVISDILINYNLATIIGHYFSKISQKLFNTSGISAYVFIMSLLSGTPSNALIVKELSTQKLLDTNSASKILAFTFFPSPLFLYTFLQLLSLTNQVAITIITISYLTNIIIGILLRNISKNNNIPNTKLLTKNYSTEFTTILVNSIKKAMTNLIMILGTITFFIMISGIINDLFNLNTLTNSILRGILELTTGLDSLITLDISLKFKTLLATFFISFGGLSIHMQIKSIITDTNISYKLFFIARLLHALIACFLVYLII